jgi:hypothetical protein
MSKTQTDYMTTLAFVRGESQTPNGNVDNRKEFVQATLEEIYAAFPFPWNKAANVALTITSGVAALPTDVSREHPLHIRYAGTDQPYNEVVIEDQDSVNEGDNIFWTTSDDGETYDLNTKETVENLYITYQKVAPIVSATVTSPINNKMLVALGANRYMKMADDPNADISQDESLFSKRLQQYIAPFKLNNPSRRRRTAQTEAGHHTGKV